MALTPEEQQVCLSLAKRTLRDALSPGGAKPVETYVDWKTAPALLREKLPCFVSLHTKAHRLRGCIGCVATDHTLAENIHRLTLAAAFEDPRFDPVLPSEVADLQVEISVLGKLHLLPSLKDVKIGKHGLRVRHDGRAGLLLAQVAAEYAWTPEEFQKQTCLKAGLSPDRASDYEWFYFEQTSFS